MKSKILKLFCEAMEEDREPDVVSSLDAHTPHNARVVRQYLEPVSGPVSEYIKTTIPKKLYYLNKSDIIGPGIHKVVEEYGHTSPLINSGAEMRAGPIWGLIQDEYVEKIGGYDIIYYDSKNPEDSVIYNWLEESNKKYNLGKEFDRHVADLSMYDPDSMCISSYAVRYWTFFILRDGYFFTTPQKIIDEWEKKYMVSIIQTEIDGGSFHEYFRYHPSIFAVGFDDDLVSDKDILEMLSKTTIKADFEDEAVRRFKMRNAVRSGD